jgi:geranylgeranyl diphosphate synthase type I
MPGAQDFTAALSERSRWVDELLLDPNTLGRIRPEHLRRLVASYLERGGKRLRPAVLMLSCGAVGGNERDVIPAAAALELFHTWTLMHDDIIDHDSLRRGGPTGHILGAELAARDWELKYPEAADYGISLSILAGDVQHGLCVAMFLGARNVPPELLVHLVDDLERNVVADLVEGETLDIQFGKQPISEVSIQDVLRMMYLKTGVLYQFAGKAGAMLGLQTTDEQDPLVQAIATFCAECGTAFQLQDDLLGVVGDQEKLGKPVGSDILEGKRTPVLLEAFRVADTQTRRRLETIVGNPRATPEQVRQAVDLLADLGALDAVARMAKQHIDKAFASLEKVAPSQYTRWLAGWANFMVEREF